MELTSSNELIPPFTNPKKAEETKLISTANNGNHSAIQLLPEHLIDQIKAGEVIERPSSLIKELVENALDAGARQIDIRLSQAGLDLISITDNGRGMSFDDLPLAFTRHATSKIERFDDLYRLHTYGFRGEALASAASVSRIFCWSIPSSSSLQGGKIELHGGKFISHIPWSGKNSGTTIQVRDLFYNTPVRLQFVRSLQSEKNAINKVLQAFLMSNPDVSFSIQWEDDGLANEKALYPACNGFAERAKQLLKSSGEQSLFFSTYSYQGHSIHAAIRAKSTKSPHKIQLLCANRRLFFDKSLQQMLIKSMGQHWPQGTSGEFVILFDVPVEKIDVNVHPNKTQLKFMDAPIVAALIRHVAEDVCRQISQHRPASTPIATDTISPANFSIPEISLSHDSIKPVLQQTSCPAGWAFFQHPQHGPCLVDQTWIALEWWRNIALPETEEVPLLVASPFDVPEHVRSQWSEWQHLLSTLSVSAVLTPQGQVLIRSVPRSLKELRINYLIAPLFHYSHQTLNDLLHGHDAPPVLTSIVQIPQEQLQLTIHALAPYLDVEDPQKPGPVKVWSIVEQWWRR